MTVYIATRPVNLVEGIGLTSRIQRGDLVNITDGAAFRKIEGLVAIGVFVEVDPDEERRKMEQLKAAAEGLPKLTPEQARQAWGLPSGE